MLLGSWNVRSLPANFGQMSDELCELAKGGAKFDILALQEVYNPLPEGKYDLTGYQKPVFRTRGCPKAHGG